MDTVHKASRPGEKDADTDRQVFWGSHRVGCVYQIDQGHRNEGKWQWSCYWFGGGNGIADDLDAALREIKKRLSDDTLPNLPEGHHNLRKIKPRD